MNNIINMARLLYKTQLNSEQRGCLKIILSSSDMLISLLDDILYISNIESGKIKLENIDFNIKDIALQVLDILSVKAGEKGIRILLAEDNLLNQKVALAMLKKKGFITDIACNGEEALEILDKNNYSLVLMDIQMPKMDGIEAARKIRDSISPNRNIPIIAMTADTTKDARQRCLDAGMNDYISKPIDMIEFFEIIEKQLLRKKSINSLAPEFKTVDPEKVFDKKELLNRIGCDEEIYREFIKIFKQDILEQMKKLKNAQDNNPEQIKILAHTIKGISANISAHGMRDAAYEIEEAEKQGQSYKIPELINKLEKEVETFLYIVEKV